MNLKITGKILQRAGTLYETAGDGAGALGMFAASETGYYDLVLTDIRMPVMDGREEARRIRLLPNADATTIPIIALTSDATADDSDRTAQSVATERLVKPIRPYALYEAIARYVVPFYADRHKKSPD